MSGIGWSGGMNMGGIPVTNLAQPVKQVIVGFDRTTGKPIYGAASGTFDTGASSKWVAQEEARYEKERVKSEQSQTSFSGIKDADVLSALKTSLSELRSSRSTQQSNNPDITGLLADYSKKAAYVDSAAAQAQNLGAAMEANKPAIQRAMEGAGTSAGSMQALLSQQLSDKASLSASALGADQAKAYGQISAQLMNTQVQSNAQDNTYSAELARLADAFKISESTSSGKSYFSAEEMNPKDATGGKYSAPGRNTYALSKSSGGYYY